MGQKGSVDDHLGPCAVSLLAQSHEEAKTPCAISRGRGHLPENWRVMAMIIPPTLKPENVKRLVDIGNRLYILNLIDHWSREERKEYVDLTAERERLRNG